MAIGENKHDGSISSLNACLYLENITSNDGEAEPRWIKKSNMSYFANGMLQSICLFIYSN